MQAKNLYLRCAGIFFLHIFLCLGLSAQGWQVRHYSVEDGLPHDVCYAIHQDQKGFIWIGTDLGLVRFGGNTFHTYGMEDGLANPYIITVGETPGGQIWATTYEGGLFNLKRDRFEKSPLIDPGFWYHPQLHFLSDSSWIQQDVRAYIYAGITRVKLPGRPINFVRWYHEDGELKGLEVDFLDKSNAYHKFLTHQVFDDNRVASLHLWSGKDKQLWMGSDKGLFILDDRNRLTTRPAHPDLLNISVEGLHGNETGDLILNSRSKVYVLKADGSLLTFTLPADVPAPHKIKISDDGRAYWGDALGIQLWTLDLGTGAFLAQVRGFH